MMPTDLPASRPSKHKAATVPRIDMTPMVDLGFLLITFFIFTTTMMEKNATPLVMPRDGPPSGLPASKAMTVLLDGDNRVYLYEGLWHDAQQQNRIVSTGYNEYTGIGKMIREKQAVLQRTGAKEGSKALVLLIKPTAKASYKNVIDALDEALINGVDKYAVVAPEPEEIAYLKR